MKGNDMDKITIIHAAMFAAIGGLTKISRSGNSVVFSAPQCGRHDLSGDEATAEKQARAAGLDLDCVTPEQIRAYQHWYSALYDARKIGQARILITRKFGLERGHQLIPANRVALVDGWGNDIDSVAVPCREYYDPEARDQLGQQGAYRFAPNYARINQAITELRQQHLMFAGATVQDNNQQQP